MDSLFIKFQSQNRPSPTATRPPPLTLGNRPRPGPSKTRETGPTIRSPTEMQGPRSVVQGSTVDAQTNSLPSRRQATNQATGSNPRGPGKTQLLPYTTNSSSGLSTKARIAGLTSLGQPNKYAGLRIPKTVIPPGESRSPVIASTTNPQSPLEPPQRVSLPRPFNEHNNQTQSRNPPVQQHSLPPPPPEEPSHDMEPDHMDVDQP